MRTTPPLGEQTLARLTFLGAAGAVTGSQFLLETHRSRVLFECGMNQGSREARRLNAAPFDHDPESLDAVVSGVDGPAVALAHQLGQQARVVDVRVGHDHGVE